jgi:hypothetical protein
MNRFIGSGLLLAPYTGYLGVLTMICHPRESGDPVTFEKRRWIPAFADTVLINLLQGLFASQKAAWS